MGDAKAPHTFTAGGAIVINTVASGANNNGQVRAQSSRLLISQVVAGGNVFLNAPGGIAACASPCTSLIQGDLVELSAVGGALGASGNVLRVNSNINGHGGLAARARDDVRLYETTGSMLLVLARSWTNPTASVLSASGGVWLETANGSILDGIYEQLAPTTAADASSQNASLNTRLGRITSTTSITVVKSADDTTNHTFTVTLAAAPSPATNETIVVRFLFDSGALTLSSADVRYGGGVARFTNANWNQAITFTYSGATSGLTFQLFSERDRPSFDTASLQFPLSVALIHYLYPQLAVPASSAPSTETSNVTAATISLIAGGATSQIGQVSGLEHLDLTNGGLTGLTSQQQGYLAGATTNDIIGKLHPLYRWTGGAQTGMDLTAQNLAGGGSWQRVGVDYLVTTAAQTVTLATNKVVLLQRRGVYGLYSYLGSAATTDLAGEDYLNTARWLRLTNADGLPVGTLLANDRTANLVTGSLVADTTVLDRVSLQLVDDVDILGGAGTKVTVSVDAGSGVALQTNDALEVEHVTSTGTGDVRLRATGNITNLTGTTAAIVTNGNLILDSGATIGTGATPLRTTIAANKSLVASAVGSITLRQLGNALTAEDVFAGVDAAITVVTGALTVGRIETGNAVSLTTLAGSILDGLQNTASTDGNVLTGNLTLSATGAIGGSGKPLDTTLTGTLTALAGSSIWLVNRGDLDAVSITSTTGNVTLDTIAKGLEAGDASIGAVSALTGNAFITAAGSVLHLAGNAASDIAALGARVNAVSGVGTAAAPIETTIGHLESAVSAGGIWLRNTGALDIGGVSSQTGIDTVGAVDVRTTGAMTISEAITTGGGTGSLESGTDMTFLPTGSLDTESGSPTVTLVATNGGIGMDDLSFVNARGGLITLTAKNQIRLSLLTTTTDVTVTSTAGDIVDNASEPGLEISAANALLRAATGIGQAANALELAVGRLEADAGTGGLWADDVNGLIIGGITSAALPGAASTTGLRAAGEIRVTTTGFLRIVEDVTSTGDAVTLDAIDSAVVTAANVVVPNTFGERLATSAADGSDLDEDLSVIGATVSAATTATLRAGDDMLIDAASAVVGGAGVVLRIDHDTADGSRRPPRRPGPPDGAGDPGHRRRAAPTSSTCTRPRSTATSCCWATPTGSRAARISSSSTACPTSTRRTSTSAGRPPGPGRWSPATSSRRSATPSTSTAAAAATSTSSTSPAPRTTWSTSTTPAWPTTAPTS